MVYLPMRQLLAYLKSNGFTNYMVSGGEIDFMRPWTKTVDDIDVENVIGSTIKTKVVTDKQGQVTLLRSGSIIALNAGVQKVASMDQYIGKHPILAVGNSDGDYEMLLWASRHPKAGLALLVHHTDAVREFQYDRNSTIGELEKGLDDAQQYGWQIIDMKNDGLSVFPIHRDL